MAFTGQLEEEVKVVVKNTFLEFDQGHKTVRDFRRYGGIFKSRARSDSPKRDRSGAEDTEDMEKEREDSLVETETASGDSSPSEVSSGNDLMSQGSFTASEGSEQDFCALQTEHDFCPPETSWADLQDFSPPDTSSADDLQDFCPPDTSWADLEPDPNPMPRRTPLRTALKSKSSPFVPMFQWNCMMAPFWEGCETEGTHYYGTGEGSSGFEQQAAMQNAGYEVDSPMGWSSGYGMQPWYPSEESAGSPYSKTQKSTSAEPNPPSQELTTVMFRNLPNDYSQKMLLELLDAEGFAGLYDFVYLPFDFKRHAGLGYAFLNMISPEAAMKIKTELQGFKKWCLPSKKILEVCYSKPLQGLAANIERYRNSPVMHPDVPEEFKPALFENKRRIPFPAPTGALRPPA